MTAFAETHARPICRSRSAGRNEGACLLCPLAPLCRAQRTRRELGALSERELADIGLARGDIDFVALATADHAGRPAAMA